MRKRIHLFGYLILFTLSISWSAWRTASAQDLAGLSICIDPGHGLGNMNQGPTGLREADINMSVSLFLKDFLKSANIDTVLLTRVDDSTNPTLSQREDQANSFGVDWFHSVHHNAFNGDLRFTLLLYEEARSFANPCPNGSARGTGVPEWPGQSDVMSQGMSSGIFTALRTSSFGHGLDWSFFGGCDGGFSLGVLNDLIMPGELSEATFFDNPVEENKLRNPDFLQLEARALFMAFLDFYQAGKLATGALAGIITDAASGDPLNGAQVLLLPTGSAYTTDDHNNGLYAFEDLPPGTYQVKVSATGFDSREASVEVKAHDFAFLDFALASALPPVVTSTLPANETTDFSVYDQIGVRFSRPMDRASVEAAFSLKPAVAGHFIWNPGNDVVLFEPGVRYEFETEYEVRLTGAALDSSGRALDGNGDGVSGDDFFFVFTTTFLDMTKPVVLDFFPTRRDTGIFLRDVFWAQFNQELDAASVNENTVLLTGDGGLSASLQIDYVQDGTRRLTVVPTELLVPGTRYFLTLTNGVTLKDGSPLQSSFKWPFNTQTQAVQTVSLDDFEGEFLWADPDDSPATLGTIADSTFFRDTASVFVSARKAAELDYEFAGASGLLQVDRLAPVSFGFNEDDEIGFYVYGDQSKNQIRLLVQDNDGDQAAPPWTAIDWSGWRLLRYKFQQLQLLDGGSGNGTLEGPEIQLAGIQLNFTGQNKGQLFFDDLIEVLPEAAVFVEPAMPGTQQPKAFVLFQNYPNPFNPATVISYQISEPTVASKMVTLQIYNLQGQKVRTLVQTAQSAGFYQVMWDGKDDRGERVSSGVYIYQLSVGRRSANKRMIFLK
ncbi:MAG: Ig-like domain-containing protein [bacterium]